VQRREAPVGTLGQVRRDDVRVQLGVERPAHAVAVGRRDQPTGALDVLPRLPAPHTHRRVLQVPKRRLHRLFVARHELARDLGRGDREQDAHRLRRAERQIERRHLRILLTAAQTGRWVARVVARDQGVELLRAHPAAEPEDLRARARPLPRRLTATRVVVILAARDLALVVLVLPLGDLAD
jgi:hypothetical protein